MNRLEKVLYTAKAHTTGGRTGMSRSSDCRLEVRLSQPGGPGTGTNPEQLAAGRARSRRRDRSRSRRERLQLGGSPLREPARDGARDGAAPCRGWPHGVSLFESNTREHRRRNDPGLRPLR
jgi:hypothetical protein